MKGTFPVRARPAPAPIMFAHRLGRKLTQIRKAGKLAPWLRPDAKSQVSVVYENDQPVAISNVERLKDSGVTAIVGAYGSGITFVTTQEAEKYRIVVHSFSTRDPVGPSLRDFFHRKRRLVYG